MILAPDPTPSQINPANTPALASTLIISSHPNLIRYTRISRLQFSVRVSYPPYVLYTPPISYFNTILSKMLGESELIKVKLSLDLIKHNVMKTYGEVEVSSTTLNLRIRWR